MLVDLWKTVGLMNQFLLTKWLIKILRLFSRCLAMWRDVDVTRPYRRISKAIILSCVTFILSNIPNFLLKCFQISYCICNLSQWFDYFIFRKWESFLWSWFLVILCCELPSWTCLNFDVLKWRLSEIEVSKPLLQAFKFQ